MKMIFKKSIPRRTFLQGVGTAIALPLLDGMVPALAAQSSAAEPPRSSGLCLRSERENHGPVDAARGRVPLSR